jgi:type I restriction enzyme M protein
MITGPLKSRIDKLWTEFWTGGITNPLTVIEQISFLMFIRLLDIAETRREKQAARTGKPIKGTFAKNQQHLRWQNLLQLGGVELLKTVRDEVFPHFREIAGTESTFGKYMADAQLLVQKPTLLVSAMSMINDLPLEKADLKGDLYEYLLSKLTTAGINGQFRTPRHIIRLMVDLLAPKPTDTIGDPACGTGGFLITTMDYLMEHNTSPDGYVEVGENGETARIPTGDLLEPYRKHIQRDMFYGFDFDVTMLRIAAMNMMLHGVENPNIEYADTLSKSFGDRKDIIDRFDLILANPPFKGSLDENDVHSSLTGKVKTKKTELLFLTLMLRMLKLGGRCAVIVPDGVLFGSSTAHVALRRLLVEDNQLEAVVKLPAGVFKPYAGVSTAILIFTKGGKTNDVWFYDVQADGFSLDDKRDSVAENDLPDVRNRWLERDAKLNHDRTAKAFFVALSDIEAAKFDLSLNRYKEVVHEAVKYDEPKVIIARLRTLEGEITKDLSELEGMLK